MPVYVHVVVAIIFIAFLYCLRIVYVGLRNKYWQRRYQKLLAKRNAVAENIDYFKWNPLLDTEDVDAQKIREYLNSKNSTK
jgi:archaellum component FlaF (FlaF/FlaG flagellin family)